MVSFKYFSSIYETKMLSVSYLNYGAILCLKNSKYSYLRDTKIIYC